MKFPKNFETTEFF